MCMHLAWANIVYSLQLGNCFVSVCTDLTVVIRTLHLKSVIIDVTHMCERDQVVYAALVHTMCPM